MRGRAAARAQSGAGVPQAAELPSGAGKFPAGSHRGGVPALTAVTRGWERVICSLVHPAPRLIALFSAAADNAKEQSAFFRLSERLGEVINIPGYVVGTKRPVLYFSQHLGKSQAARWRHYWQRPGSPEAPGSGFPAVRSSTPVLVFGAVREQGLPRWFGAADPGEPLERRPGFPALGARRCPTDRRSGAEKSLPGPAGERPLTSGHLWPLLPGALGGWAGAALPGGLPVPRYLLLLLLLPGKCR